MNRGTGSPHPQAHSRYPLSFFRLDQAVGLYFFQLLKLRESWQRQTAKESQCGISSDGMKCFAWSGNPNAVSKAVDYAKFFSRAHDAVIRVYDTAHRKYRRNCLPSPMPNESKAPEEYVSDALDLMVKARWVKQYGQSAKGLRVDWTDRGKLAMDALGYVIEDLGPESLNQQLWWAVGTLAAVHMMP